MEVRGELEETCFIHFIKANMFYLRDQEMLFIHYLCYSEPENIRFSSLKLSEDEKFFCSVKTDNKIFIWRVSKNNPNMHSDTFYLLF